MTVRTLLSVILAALILPIAAVSAQPWTYADSTGQTVTLDAVPQPAFWLRNYRVYASELGKLTTAIAAAENLTQ